MVLISKLLIKCGIVFIVSIFFDLLGFLSLFVFFMKVFLYEFSGMKVFFSFYLCSDVIRLSFFLL